jgi:hypothetical protein
MNTTQDRLQLLSELCQKKSLDVWVNRPKDPIFEGNYYYPDKNPERYLKESELWEKAAKDLKRLATPNKEKFQDGIRSVISAALVALFWFGLIGGLVWWNNAHNDSDASQEQAQSSPTPVSSDKYVADLLAKPVVATETTSDEYADVGLTEAASRAHHHRITRILNGRKYIWIGSDNYHLGWDGWHWEEVK